MLTCTRPHSFEKEGQIIGCITAGVSNLQRMWFILERNHGLFNFYWAEMCQMVNNYPQVLFHPKDSNCNLKFQPTIMFKLNTWTYLQWVLCSSNHQLYNFKLVILNGGDETWYFEKIVWNWNYWIMWRVFSDREIFQNTWLSLKGKIYCYVLW